MVKKEQRTWDNNLELLWKFPDPIESLFEFFRSPIVGQVPCVQHNICVGNVNSGIIVVCVGNAGDADSAGGIHV